MSAEGNINLVATGKKQDPDNEAEKAVGGNILIQGSDINAGNNLSLIAHDQINIRAAANNAAELSSSKSSSGSIGMTYAGGLIPHVINTMRPDF